MSQQTVGDIVRVPSYARPTNSSRARNQQPTPGIHHCNAGVPSKKPPRQPATGRDFKSYLTTTTAYRNSARCPQPFRFFDLPSEVRNHVYEFLDLQPPRFDGPLHLNLLDPKTLPPILQVDNQQLRAEAGSYLFRAHEIDISTDAELSRLVEFLADMGAANCRLLAAHPRLRLRLVQPEANIRAFKRACKYSMRSATVTPPTAKEVQRAAAAAAAAAAAKPLFRLARLRLEEQQRRRAQCFVQLGEGLCVWGTEYSLRHVWPASFTQQIRFPNGFWVMQERCKRHGEAA